MGVETETPITPTVVRLVGPACCSREPADVSSASSARPNSKFPSLTAPDLGRLTEPLAQAARLGPPAHRVTEPRIAEREVDANRDPARH